MLDLDRVNLNKNKVYSYVLSNEVGLIHIDSGKCKVEINNKTKIIDNKTYIILNQYDMLRIATSTKACFTIFKIKEKELTQISIKMNSNISQYFDNISFNERFFTSSPHSDLLTNIFYSMISEVRQEESLYLETSQESHLLELQRDAWIILYLTHLYKVRNNISKSRKSSKLELLDITSYLYLNYSDPNISLESISNNFGVTKTYLNKFYKEKTGETIMSSIIKYRLTKAIKLLKNGKQVNEVYLLVGFNSYTNFFKQFKKAYQMSPLEYIKSSEN